MVKKIVMVTMIALFLVASISVAAETATTAKKQGFWQRLFNYPANVTKESAKVVNKTSADSARMVVKEIKTAGDVSTGDVKKSGALVTEPVKNTVNTTAGAIKGTASVPFQAAKDGSVDDTVQK